MRGYRDPTEYANATHPHNKWEMEDYQRRFVAGLSRPVRCDITGQPLTVRERFDRECG